MASRIPKKTKMKINSKDIKVGYKLQSFDEDDNKWYKTVVRDVTPEQIVLTDIDPKSEWVGMKWEVTWDEIENVKLFKK
jgi:hypothetical protein